MSKVLKVILIFLCILVVYTLVTLVIGGYKNEVQSGILRLSDSAPHSDLIKVITDNLNSIVISITNIVTLIILMKKEI